MSEYLIKKAVLEWLKEQQKQQEENRDRLEIDHPYWEYHEGASDYLSLAVEKFESGAFDAEQTCTQENPCPECLKKSVDGYKLIESELNTEIKRLRAALTAMRQAVWDELVPIKLVTKINKIADEALSTTAEPTNAAKVERFECPCCGCEISINSPEGDGNDI